MYLSFRSHKTKNDKCSILSLILLPRLMAYFFPRMEITVRKMTFAILSVSIRIFYLYHHHLYHRQSIQIDLYSGKGILETALSYITFQVEKPCVLKRIILRIEILHTILLCQFSYFNKYPLRDF